MSSFNVAQILPSLDSGGVERGTIEVANYLSELNLKNNIISNGGRLIMKAQEGERILLQKKLLRVSQIFTKVNKNFYMLEISIPREIGESILSIYIKETTQFFSLMFVFI